MSDSNAKITRTELIRRAFRRIGIGTPSNNQSAQAAALLNDIVKEIDTEGRWLWAVSNVPSPLTLAASQASYGAGSGAALIPLYLIGLERAELVINTPPYLPLTVLSRDDWYRSIFRGTTGRPLQCYFEKAADSANSKLWFAPTPDAIYSANLFVRRRLYDFDSASGNPDFPQDWALRLAKRLSYELSPEYGLPLEERQTLKMESDEAMTLGKAANAEEPTNRPVRFKGQYS
jgi:hypothetical protein